MPRLRNDLLHYRRWLPLALKTSRLSAKRRTLLQWQRYLDDQASLEEKDAFLNKTRRFLRRTSQAVLREEGVVRLLNGRTFVAVQRAALRQWMRYRQRCMALKREERGHVGAMNVFRGRRLFAMWVEKAAIRTVIIRIIKQHRRAVRIRCKARCLTALQCLAETQTTAKSDARRGADFRSRRLFSYFFMLTQRLLIKRHQRRRSLVRGDMQFLRWSFATFYARHQARRRVHNLEWRCGFNPQDIYSVEKQHAEEWRSHSQSISFGAAKGQGRLCKALATVSSTSSCRALLRGVVSREKARIVVQLWRIRSRYNRALHRKLGGVVQARKTESCRLAVDVMYRWMVHCKKQRNGVNISDDVYWRRRMRWCFVRLRRKRRYKRHMSGVTWVTKRVRKATRDVIVTLKARVRRAVHLTELGQRMKEQCQRALTKTGLAKVKRYHQKIRLDTLRHQRSITWRASKCMRLRTAVWRLRLFALSTARMRDIRSRFTVIPAFKHWWCMFVQNHRDRSRVFHMTVSRHLAMQRNVLVHWSLFALKRKRQHEQAQIVRARAAKGARARYMERWLEACEISRVNKLVLDVKRRRMRWLKSVSLRRWYLHTSARIVRRRTRIADTIRSLEGFIERNKRLRQARDVATNARRRQLHRRTIGRWRSMLRVRNHLRRLVSRGRGRFFFKCRFFFDALRLRLHKRKRLNRCAEHHCTQLLIRTYGRPERVPKRETVTRLTLRDTLQRMRTVVSIGKSKRARRLRWQVFNAWHRLIVQQNMDINNASRKLVIVMRLRKLRVFFEVLRYRREYKQRKRVVQADHRYRERFRHFRHWFQLGKQRVVTRARVKRIMEEKMKTGLFDRERMMRLALSRWRVKVYHGSLMHIKRILRSTWELWGKAVKAGELYRYNLKARAFHAYHEWSRFARIGRRIILTFNRAATIHKDFQRRYQRNAVRAAFTRFAIHAGLKPHTHDIHMHGVQRFDSHGVYEKRAAVRPFGQVDVDGHLAALVRQGQIGHKRISHGHGHERGHGHNKHGHQKPHFTGKFSANAHHKSAPHRDLHKRLQSQMQQHRSDHEQSTSRISFK